MRWLTLVLLMGQLNYAVAETQTTSVTVAPAKGQSTSGLRKLIGDKKFEENKKITDLELRANAGSRSRYSLQATLGYSGPPVNQLSDANRPNPDNRPGDGRTLLSGSAGFRVRVTPSKAINLSTGIAWFAPYQAVKGEDVNRPANTKNYDIYNPAVSFDNTYVVGATQMRSSVQLSATTADAYKNAGQWAGVQIAQAVKYTPLMGRLILGARLQGDYFAYDRDYQAKDTKHKINGDGNVSRFYFHLIPSVEYKLTDKMNFNTSLGYPYQNLRSKASWWNWDHQLSTWRVGLGWAITPEIYLNPYVNFFAEAPAFNTASMNFSTVFSIF